ncbi:type I toxin-antitoxin system toxin TisB [Atlantibacter hermannii]|uniref:Type I toxin-antitoxin system toxin TisB n=2 Tax=Atlantibacter subterraneus TaxID=255519 RepID=A0A3R9F7W3_9ENTR|nr:type I toxin-antitoxin system toxin TisB [Atlantibacter sp.]MBL7635258.1 type I toxin-antitoxin system toxin TisB [Atlantibacter hermannii]QFH69159.1 type I toxin-antitoxin system toxin TisB [Enterobacter sp. E76]RSB63906.1 type I toxin-antitoxin system toxin TisB [Atlantibacter subterranea]MBL7673243.1 type I toxin-antitoxin system toxin TisB [Atlantibacter hermannii]NBC97686.1 type I toxin-antitoxin system toxin TisB [Atlantibacter hermannii]
MSGMDWVILVLKLIVALLQLLDAVLKYLR